MTKFKDPKAQAKFLRDFDRDFVFRAIYSDPFVTLKFDWTIEDYNVDVNSGYESPPLRLYDKTVHFVLERHRNDDDGTYYDSLGMRSSFKMTVSGSVTVNDDAEITIGETTTADPPSEIRCLVKKLSLVNMPKVKFLIDVQLNGFIKKRVFAVEKKRVTKMDVEKCRGNFVDDVRGLCQNPQFSDVRFCTPDGKTIPAHKGILSARSPVFAAMFNHPTKENVLGVVEVRDVPSVPLERFIGFLYGRMPDFGSFDKMADFFYLYYASDKYQVLDLRLLVSQSMVARMPYKMAAEVVEVFDHHGDEDGIMLAVDHCIMYYEDIEKADGFKDMNPKYYAMVMERIHQFL